MEIQCSNVNIGDGSKSLYVYEKLNIFILACQKHLIAYSSLDDVESCSICALCDGGALVWREGGGDGEDGAEVVGRLGGGVGEGDPVHVRHDVRVDDERSELRVR